MSTGKHPTGTHPPLRRDDAAKYLKETFGFRCSTQWLAKLACIGGGPPYRLANRTPLYSVTDLDMG